MNRLPENYYKLLPAYLHNIRIDAFSFTQNNNLEPFSYRGITNYVSLGQDRSLETTVTDLNTNKRYFVNFYTDTSDPKTIRVDIIPFDKEGVL